MEKILILGAGIYQLPLIKKAKSLGLYTIVVSIKGNYPGFKYADNVYFENTTDTERILEITKTEKIDGICTTGTDVALATLGKVCTELGLNGITYDSALKSTDKLLMKKAFKEYGVRTANFGFAEDFASAQKIFADLNKPVMLKVVDSSGSRGIIKVETEAQLANAYSEIAGFTKSPYIILEEFIDGPEFGAQALIHKNDIMFYLPHNDKVFWSDTGVPVGHSVPAGLGGKVLQDGYTQLEKSIKALGLNNCAINADFMVKDDKVYVLEIGARAGATGLVEMVSVYYGIDYYELLLNVALDKDIDCHFNSCNPNAVELLTSDKSGKIKSITNNNSNNINVIDISFDYNIGEHVNKFKVGPDRIGQIIVKGNSLNEALALLEDTKRNINIEIE